MVSVYINFKKCFAFVELKSIELTTACLELDGIVYRNSVLKVQRANEYKPDAISNLRSSIKLSLPPEVFSGAISIPPPTVIETNEPRFGSLIVQGPMSAIERGAVVLLGFPFDEGSRRSAYGRPGGATAPKIIRRFINKLGAHYNPEFELSIANVLIVDIGDIPVGLTLDEAHSRLALVIAEIVQRGGIPFIIGGSCDMSYFSAAGLMTVTGGGLGVLNVTSQLNVKPPNNDNKIHSGSTFRLLLEDTRFCSPALRNGLAPSSPASCEGKFVAFGCQGTTCSGEQSRYVLDRNGKLFWLSKDIRTYSPPLDSPSPSVPRIPEKMCNTAAAKLFKKVLFELKEGSPMSPEGQPPTTNKPPRPVMIAFNLESMAPSVCPGVSAGSSLGIHAEEALEICFAAGADPGVVLFDISECNPDVEELRTCRFVADMFCSFVFGIATRTGQRGVSPRSSSLQRQAGHVQATLFKPPAIQSSSLTSISDPFDLSGQGISAAVQQHQNELAFSSSQNNKSMSLNRPYSLGAPGQRSSSIIPGLQTVTEMFNGNEGGRSRLLTTHHHATEDLPRSPTAGSHTSNLQPSW